jgi:hypothetical protein
VTVTDKTVTQHAAPAGETPKGFYLLVGVMAVAFLLIVGYMIYLYLS